MNRDVTVSEVMDRAFVGVSESDGVGETVELLLREEAEVAVVLRGQEPIGILTDRDVMSLLVDDEDPASTSVGEAMTEVIPSIEPNATLAAARDRMISWDVHQLVVTDDGEPTGVLTEHDVLSSTTLGRESTQTEMAESDTATPVAESSASAPDAATGEMAGGGFEEQSICEKCGSLAPDLASFNGQVLCADCRDI